MRTLAYILLACVVLAAMKAALALLLVVLALGLVWSAATRPRETAGLLGMLILTGLAHDHGLAFLSIAGLALIVCAFRHNSPTEATLPKVPALEHRPHA